MNTLTNRRRSYGRPALMGLAAALLAIAFLASARPAQADLSFCPPGSGAGQCLEPNGVATDFETGRVYVADRDNHRINVFEADGDFLFAFGWGVDTGAAKLEICTSACLAGLSGTGAGQLSSPRWIAVDNVAGSATRHDVYVVDGNARVSHFAPDGSFVNAFGWGADTGAAKLETCTTASSCQAGIAGPGECQLSGAYRPVSVGPGGSVFVVASLGDEPNFTNKVMELSPSGACLGETVVVKGNFRFEQLAVDAAGDAYVTVERAESELRKYDLAVAESAPLCVADPGMASRAIALDEAGHLFAAQRELPPHGGLLFVVTEYDAECNKVRRFGYGKLQGSPRGVAALHSAEGDVFVTQPAGDGVRYLKAPAPGPIVVPDSVEAGPIGNTKATLKAEVNPEGKATSYRVDYVDEASYEADLGGGGDGFDGSQSTTPKALDIPVGKEFNVLLAEALVGCAVATEQLIEEGKCLEPETAYRFRIVATNADNPTGAGEGTVEGSFTTKPAIEVGDVYATDVGTDAATINADVNPLGIPASGYFEYVDEATFQASAFADAIRIPDTEAGEEPIDFGAAETATRRGVSLYPLPPGTTYRYRLVATNPFLDAPILTGERSFTTFRPQVAQTGQCPANEAFRAAAAALLPDCRAYELVSPLDKANGDIKVLTQVQTSLPAVLSQSAASGDRLTYGSYRSFGDAKSAAYTSQYLAARDPQGGWEGHGISPPQEQLIGDLVFDFEFRAFSEDLCDGWVVPQAGPPLAEGVEAGNRNLYRRTDELCGGESYEAITTAKPENLSRLFLPEPQGHSADGEVTAFAALDSLEGTGAPLQPPGCADSNLALCEMRLYVKGSEGQPRFACILPGGAASAVSCSAGTSNGAQGRNRIPSVTNALSADGTRLFWTDSVAAGRIYLRENPLSQGAECAEAGSPCTTAVSKAGEEASGPGGSRFWVAAKDGSAAIFSVGGSATAAGDLYAYDVEDESTQLIAKGFRGMAGASEDASRVYFASTEVLTEVQNGEADKAQPGQPNLYLYEAGEGGGSYRFVATLAGADVNPPDASANISSATAFEPRVRNARVNPTGSHVAFMSFAPLTGYDNKDAKSAKADTEVFLYDAEANGGAGELRCASCNPSGARPAGRNMNLEASPFWVAGRLPVHQTTLYAGRLLSEDGSRLFFESTDALVARDTNGRVDVYQWEQEGVGSCDQADVNFVPDSGGCVELVSSGKGLTDSAFIDASPSGNDVFFTTLASFLPQDYGLTDIYDARVGGGFPTPPAPPAPCLGDACQNPAPPPDDPTPASASFRGAGDPRPQSSKPRKPRCPKGKRRVRRGGKSRCAPARKQARGADRRQGGTAR